MSTVGSKTGSDEVNMDLIVDTLSKGYRGNDDAPFKNLVSHNPVSPNPVSLKESNPVQSSLQMGIVGVQSALSLMNPTRLFDLLKGRLNMNNLNSKGSAKVKKDTLVPESENIDTLIDEMMQFSDNSDNVMSHEKMDYRGFWNSIKDYYDRILDVNSKDYEYLLNTFRTEARVLEIILKVRQEYDFAVDAVRKHDLVLKEIDLMDSQISSGKYSRLSDADIQLLKSKEYDKLVKVRRNMKSILEENRISDLGHSPAFIYVIGFDESDSKHSQNIRYENKLDTVKYIHDRDSFDLMRRIAYEDGAVILGRSGNIISLNSVLPNESLPDVVRNNSEAFRIPYDADCHDSIKLGFSDDKIGTRNMNSIAASYQLEGTVIYTSSEQTGNIRRMKNGLITHSTKLEESVFLKVGYVLLFSLAGAFIFKNVFGLGAGVNAGVKLLNNNLFNYNLLLNNNIFFNMRDHILDKIPVASMI